MKIGLVSHWYDPESGAAAGPGIAARALRDRGHDVQVLTGFPHYPHGRLFQGYKLRPYLREVIDGVTVHRVPIYPNHGVRALPRAANYLSYAASGAVASAFALRKVESVLVYSTPATAAVPALPLRALRGIPFALWIQDLWPQTVTSSGFLNERTGSRAERGLHRYCDAVYRRAARIAVTSPGMAQLIKEREVPAERIDFVPNWADEEAFRPTTTSPQIRNELGPLRPFTAMYAGNLGEMQNLDTVLDAASKLRDLHDLGIVLVGDGVRKSDLQARSVRAGLDNVHFVDSQPFSRMSEVLAIGDVQLVTLKNLPLFQNTLPSKLQANLAAGRPIIGAIAGDAATVLDRSGAGITTTPGDANQLADAIRTMYAMPETELAARGQRARAYYLEHFSEEVVGGRLSDLLVGLAGSR